jgi:hypothetical protein
MRLLHPLASHLEKQLAVSRIIRLLGSGGAVTGVVFVQFRSSRFAIGLHLTHPLFLTHPFSFKIVGYHGPQPAFHLSCALLINNVTFRAASAKRTPG